MWSRAQLDLGLIGSLSVNLTDTKGRPGNGQRLCQKKAGMKPRPYPLDGHKSTQLSGDRCFSTCLVSSGLLAGQLKLSAPLFRPYSPVGTM